MQWALALFVALTAPPNAAITGPGPGALVSAAELNQHLHDAGLVIVQVGRKVDYDQGHVAGARYADGGLESDDMMKGPTMDMSLLPSAASIRGKLERLGVSDRSHVVVVYSAKGAPSATRLIYLARYAGFDHTSLLDGGTAAWQGAGLSLSKDVPAITPGKITAVAAREPGVDYLWVQSHLKAPKIKIIDARDTTYYGGAASADMQMAAGHIPGAHNVPYWSLFNDAGLYRSPAEITAKFRAAGVQPGDTVVAYCHVGVQATAVVFAARLIGQPVTMYTGSFHDWSAHQLPTEGGKP